MEFETRMYSKDGLGKLAEALAKGGFDSVRSDFRGHAEKAGSGGHQHGGARRHHGDFGIIESLLEQDQNEYLTMHSVASF
jgi:hypothetical protein